MADKWENIVRNVARTEVRFHWRKLVLVPTFRDTGCNVEYVAGNNEEILALRDARRDVVFKVAGISCDFSSRGDCIIPDQWNRSVISASNIVVVQDRVPVRCSISRTKRSLLCSSTVAWINWDARSHWSTRA